MQEGQHDAGPPSQPPEAGNPFADSGNPFTDGTSSAEGTTQPPQYQTDPNPNFQQQSSYAPVPVTPSAYPTASTNSGSPQPQSTFYSVQMHSSTPTSNPDYTQAPTYSINNDPPSTGEKVESDYSSENLRADEPTPAFAIIGGEESNPFDDDEDFSSDSSEDEGKGSHIEPKKPLGVIGLVSMVYFLVAGGAYGTEDLGGSIPALFALGGILLIPWVWSLPISLLVAELATTLPADSGFLLWSKRAFGEFVYWVDGWILIMVIIIDQTIYPRIFVDYLENGDFVKHDLEIHLDFWSAWAVSIAYIGVCMVINLLGIANLGRATFFFSLFTLIPFALFSILGLFSSQFDPGLLFKVEMTGGKDWDFSLYLSVLIWATCGYEYSGFLAPDVQKPERTFPIGMISTNILMLSTYFFPIAIAIAVAPDQTYIFEGAYPALADDFGYGSWFGILMTIGGLVSTMGTYIAYLHTSSTALRALAADGTAPWVFNLFPHIKVPVISILFFSLTTAILVVFDFAVLVQTASFLYCIHALLLCSSYIKLRWSEPDLVRPYRLPLDNFGASCVTCLPMLVAASQCFSLVIENWLYALLSSLGILVGIGAYIARYYWHQYRANQQRAAQAQPAPVEAVDSGSVQ